MIWTSDKHVHSMPHSVGACNYTINEKNGLDTYRGSSLVPHDSHDSSRSGASVQVVDIVRDLPTREGTQ